MARFTYCVRGLVCHLGYGPSGDGYGHDDSKFLGSARTGAVRSSVEMRHRLSLENSGRVGLGGLRVTAAGRNETGGSVLGGPTIIWNPFQRIVVQATLETPC
jgi:hypothetical protein